MTEIPISRVDALKLGISEHEGWTGAFTRQQSLLARFANGTRVVKIGVDRNDLHPLGTCGTVLGSLSWWDAGIRGVFMFDIDVGYFVEWDLTPRTAIFVVDIKLAAAEEKRHAAS